MGNPQEGPSAVFMKFPPNFPGAMHSHSHGYRGLVVTGASMHYVQGESEAEVPLVTPGTIGISRGKSIITTQFLSTSLQIC